MAQDGDRWAPGGKSQEAAPAAKEEPPAGDNRWRRSSSTSGPTSDRFQPPSRGEHPGSAFACCAMHWHRTLRALRAEEGLVAGFNLPARTLTALPGLHNCCRLVLQCTAVPIPGCDRAPYDAITHTVPTVTRYFAPLILPSPNRVHMHKLSRWWGHVQMAQQPHRQPTGGGRGASAAQTLLPAAATGGRATPLPSAGLPVPVVLLCRQAAAQTLATRHEKVEMLQRRAGPMRGRPAGTGRPRMPARAAAAGRSAEVVAGDSGW